LADLKISELQALAGADLVAADELAVADISASETKKITVSDLIAYGADLIANAEIPSAKISFAAGSIVEASLATDAVTATKIGADAVTAAKLADQSTCIVAANLTALQAVTGDFVGQLGFTTDNAKVYLWQNSTWNAAKAAGSINTITADTTGIVNITVSTSGDTATVGTSLDATTGSAEFLAGPTGSAGAVGYRAIVGTDLPVPTTTTKGAIAVNGEGLRMDGDRLEVDNDITLSSTHHVVTYDAKGLINGGRTIISTDLPAATSGAIGAVTPGTGLAVTGAGALNHTNVVTPGTYTKITFDAQGHVTAGTALADTDLPNHSAALLTSGTLPADRIAADAITAAKLSDYSTTTIGNSPPAAEHIGQFFFNPLERTLFLWDGNVYQPVGISAGEIVFAGTYDASVNQVDSVTTDGAAIGLVSGSALPAAGASNRSYYVVVSQTGTGTAPAPTVTLEPPDILLSNGTSWVLLEVSETVTAQLASNVQFSPTGDITATNVQSAIAEVDSEKLPKAGGTMTGNLELGQNVALVFEGSTADGNETTLTVADPTADRTITLPNVSGTVVTTGDSGTVTSAMIADATIVDADISGSAEIAVSKLADGSARQLLQTDAAGTGVEWASNIDIPGTLDVTGAATFDSSVAVTGALTKSGSNVVTVGDTGTVTSSMIADGTIVDADVNAGAAIAYSKLATLTSANILVGNSSNVATSVAVTGDVTISNTGVTAISSGVVVNADVNASAAIAGTKISPDFGSQTVQTTGIFSHALGTASAPTVTFTGDTNTGIYSPGADQVAISTNGVNRFQIDASGNISIDTNTFYLDATNNRVGIGTVSPGRTFVVNAQDAAVEIASSSAGTYTNEGIFFKVDGTDYGQIYNDGSNALVFRYNGGSGLQERMRLDSSGRLGLGTSSPGTLLHVSGTSTSSLIRIANTTNGAASFDGSGSGLELICGPANTTSKYTPAIKFGSTDPEFTTTSPKFGAAITAEATETYGSDTDGGMALGFWTSPDNPGTGSGLQQRLTITNSGNVGIGTTSPGVNLEIAGTTPSVRLTETDSTGFSQIYVDGAVLNIDVDPTAAAASSAIRFNVDNSERARIDSSGRLLVGTSTSFDTTSIQTSGANAGLAVNSGSDQIILNRYTAADTGSFVFLGKSRSATIGTNTVVNDGDTLGGLLFRGADGTNFVNAARIAAQVDGTPGTNDMPGRLVFSTTADGASSPTERMRITSTGRLYVGTTTGTINTTNTGFALYPSGYFNQGGNFDGTQELSRFYGNAGSVRFMGDGDVENTNNSYGAISDIKLKENIVDANSQWNDLKALQVRNYNLKADTGYSTHTQIGLIAQEVELVSPGLVSESPDRDAEGNDLGTVTKSVNYSVLYMKAVKALQEAMERIETLEAKVAALEGV
jgi:hypothetical protein